MLINLFLFSGSLFFLVFVWKILNYKKKAKTFSLSPAQSNNTAESLSHPFTFLFSPTVFHHYINVRLDDDETTEWSQLTRAGENMWHGLAWSNFPVTFMYEVWTRNLHSKSHYACLSLKRLCVCWIHEGPESKMSKSVREVESSEIMNKIVVFVQH